MLRTLVSASDEEACVDGLAIVLHRKLKSVHDLDLAAFLCTQQCANDCIANVRFNLDLVWIICATIHRMVRLILFAA